MDEQRTRGSLTAVAGLDRRRRRLALLLAVAGLVVGSVVLGLACKSNNINSTTNNSVSETIGASGGVLDGPDGIVVDFPAGAVPTSTEFTISTTNTYPDLQGRTLIGPVFSLVPHGFVFAGSVTVSIPLDGAPSAQVLHSSCDSAGNCQPWDTSVTSVNFANGDAIFSTPSFSLYTLVTGGAADAGSPDTGVPDTSVTDTGVADTGPSDTGPSDTGPSDTGLSDASDGGADSGSTGCASLDGGACNALDAMATALQIVNCIDTLEGGTVPTPAGGTIVDGTYTLSAATLYQPGTCPGGFEYGITLTISGECWQQAIAYPADGGGGAYANANFSGVMTSGTNLAGGTLSCGYSPVESSSYTATPTTLTMFSSGDAGPGYTIVFDFTKM